MKRLLHNDKHHCMGASDKKSGACLSDSDKKSEARCTSDKKSEVLCRYVCTLHAPRLGSTAAVHGVAVPLRAPMKKSSVACGWQKKSSQTDPLRKDHSVQDRDKESPGLKLAEKIKPTCDLQRYHRCCQELRSTTTAIRNCTTR